jgi:hypothetical protein
MISIFPAPPDNIYKHWLLHKILASHNSRKDKQQNGYDERGEGEDRLFKSQKINFALGL